MNPSPKTKYYALKHKITEKSWRSGSLLLASVEPVSADLVNLFNYCLADICGRKAWSNFDVSDKTTPEKDVVIVGASPEHRSTTAEWLLELFAVAEPTDQFVSNA